MFCAGCGKLHSGKMCKNVQKSSGVFFARFSVFAHVGKVRSGILSCWGVCAVSPGGPGGRGGRFWRKWPKMAKNGQNGPRGPGGQKWPKMGHFGTAPGFFLKGAWMSSRTFPPDYTLIRIAARGVCTGNSHRFPACAGVGFPTGFPPRAPGSCKPAHTVATRAHSVHAQQLRAHRRKHVDRATAFCTRTFLRNSRAQCRRPCISNCCTVLSRCISPSEGEQRQPVLVVYTVFIQLSYFSFHYLPFLFFVV